MKTWAAIASLFSAASSAADMASYMGPVSAFFLSARNRRITCTPSATLMSTSWVIASPCGDAPARSLLPIGKDWTHATRHLRAERLKAGSWANHDLELLEVAVRVEADHVDALEILVRDLGAELEHHAPLVVKEAAVVAELFEDL